MTRLLAAVEGYIQAIRNEQHEGKALLELNAAAREARAVSGGEERRAVAELVDVARDAADKLVCLDDDDEAVALAARLRLAVGKVSP